MSSSILKCHSTGLSMKLEAMYNSKPSSIRRLYGHQLNFYYRLRFQVSRSEWSVESYQLTKRGGQQLYIHPSSSIFKVKPPATVLEQQSDIKCCESGVQIYSSSGPEPPFLEQIPSTFRRGRSSRHISRSSLWTTKAEEPFRRRHLIQWTLPQPRVCVVVPASNPSRLKCSHTVAIAE
jgi:hypothetical protein